MAAPLPHDEEGLLRVPSSDVRPRRIAAVALASAAVACASGAVVLGAVTLLHGAGAAHRSVVTAPRTVRQLLESDELKDVTTDNLLALHGAGASGRELVREEVARSILRIEGALQQLHPTAHQVLGSLDLTDTEREAAMGRVRRFGDARMVGLSHAVSGAVEENRRAGGDDQDLQLRLTRTLGPRMGDLQALQFEMGQDGKWHTQLSVDAARLRAEPAPRRLAEVSGVLSSGVNTHVLALFESLEEKLGDKMPKAPARMLSSMFETSSSLSPGSDDDAATAKFMDCIKAAVPDPTKVCSCIADNIEKVVSMVMTFLKSKTSR